MRDLNVRPAPPGWVWHSCKTKSSNDFKINWCNQNQTILSQSSPKNHYLQKRIMEIHFMIPFLTQNLPQKVTISKSIMIDWLILYDKI